MDEPSSSYTQRKRKGKRRLAPVGLKGRDIGLFYRDISRATSAEESIKVTELYIEKAKNYGSDPPIAKSRADRRRERNASRGERRRERRALTKTRKSMKNELAPVSDILNSCSLLLLEIHM